MGYGGPGLMALGFGRERARERGEREARGRQEVTTPLRCTPPQTPGYIVGGFQVAFRRRANHTPQSYAEGHLGVSGRGEMRADEHPLAQVVQVLRLRPVLNRRVEG